MSTNIQELDLEMDTGVCGALFNKPNELLPQFSYVLGLLVQCFGDLSKCLTD